MNTDTYREKGAQIAGVLLGVNYDELKGASEAFDVESENINIKSAATVFYKNAAASIASNMLSNGELSEELFLLRKMASTSEWTHQMQDFVDGYLVKNATDRTLHRVACSADAKEFLVKNAGPAKSLVVGGVSRAMQYTPALAKALLALGAIGGTAAGGLYWGINRHLDEDSSIENDLMDAQVDEYHKLRQKLKADLENSNIKTLADQGKLGSI